MFLNIMFHAPIRRFQLESTLKLLLFSCLAVVPFNKILWFLQAFRYFCNDDADDVTNVTKGPQDSTKLTKWYEGEV